MTTAERWRAIPGRDGYQVSDMGRVRSVDREVRHRNGTVQHRRGQIVRAFPIPRGYLAVFTGGRLPSAYVHRLVLEAFVGPCPAGMQCLHGNDDPSDNRLVNLRWGTPVENAQDMVSRGRKAEMRRTQCPAGHPLAAPNLVRSELPSRKCRACNCAHSRLQRLRRQGQTGDFTAIANHYLHQIMNDWSEVA